MCDRDFAVLIAQRRAAGGAEQKIRHRVARVAAIVRILCERAVEGKISAGESRGNAAQVFAAKIEAHFHGVTAPNLEKIVRHLK